MKQTAIARIAAGDRYPPRAVFWLPVVVATAAALWTLSFLAAWATALSTAFALWAGLKWLVWQYTVLDLLAEAPGALFHPPFLRNVVLPLMRVVYAV